MVNFVSTLLLGLAAGHAIPGIGSIEKQLVARDENYMDSVYNNLPDQDIDFINYHLKGLTGYNGTDCNKCKNKIKYGQSLLHEQPDKKHLISLLLFKYCIEENKGKESKCDNIDFFVTTNSLNSNTESGDFAGYQSETSINFYDNDFLSMLNFFNVSSDLDLEYYCHFKAKSCELPETPDIERYDFDSKWPAKQPHQYFEPTYNESRELFNVLHISDFHNQLRYAVGSEANCTSNGLCCLPEVYNEDLPKDKNHNFTDVYYDLDPSLENGELNISFYPNAHYDENNQYVKGDYYDYPKYRGWDFNWLPATTFGNYDCDPPETLMNNSLKYISEYNQSYEFSIFTGDIVDHDVYHCDANTTKFAEVRSYGIMKHFLKNLSVYPTLGNHDTFPYGQLPSLKLSNHLDTDKSSYHWNSDLLSKLWTSNDWLPKNDMDQIANHYAGFATVTKKGLKIISLNSNCYYQKNLWAYIGLEEDPDLFGQWEFLINELVESEKTGQRVWIMAHIPAGDSSALPIQSSIFAKIVKRFSPYTIANIFYGHTHKDQFKILYNDTDPINMAWISQAITPLGPSNPSWRYYQVEDESFNIINSFNYYTELNKTFTNDGNEPEWLYEYSARDTYDPEHEWPEKAPLNATFWNRFVVEPIKNESNIEFNQKYTDLLHRFAPGTPDCKNGSVISDQCYTDNICDMSSFTSDEYNKCQRGSFD